jgi:hypothetical protein
MLAGGRAFGVGDALGFSSFSQTAESCPKRLTASFKKNKINYCSLRKVRAGSRSLSPG